MTMADREKLIELLEEIGVAFPISKANFLIANGVTIQRWIPASEPPKEYGKYLVRCENTKLAQIRLFEGEWDSIQKVTHWMPLP